MDIHFANTRLEKLCGSASELQRQHGQDCARKLMARLLDLEAAASLEDMRTLPGGCHELAGDRDGQLAVKLAGGKRLIIEPTADPAPTSSGGGLHWAAVTAVRVVAIVDYHRG